MAELLWRSPPLLLTYHASFDILTMILRLRQQMQIYSAYISFDALNLWASKREFGKTHIRIETQNSCLLNLWRQESVISFTAVAAVKRAALECIINIHMHEIVLKHLYINLIHVERG